MQANEIEPKLKELSRLASSEEPGLAHRLDEVRRWIKDMRPGLLMQKNVLMAFLLELISDADFWLNLKSLEEEERQLFLDRLSSPVRYWYEVLFPKWFNENDSRFYVWKQKLRSGEFDREDAELIEAIAAMVASREGIVVHRYIADLSMATDVIVSSSSRGKPLCVQLTTMSDKFSEVKYNEWKHTLQQWQIERGIFISYNPGEDEFVDRLVNVVLHNSNHLDRKKYVKFSFC